MVSITLCNAKSAAGTGQDCFISYLALFILCSQCLSRWFYKKLVFLLFYNGDIIPVSAFLYFFIFLNRVILTCARLSTNTTVIQPGNKTATVPLASPHVFPRTRQGHIQYTCIATRQHLAPNVAPEAFDGKKAREPLMAKSG